MVASVSSGNMDIKNGTGYVPWTKVYGLSPGTPGSPFGRQCVILWRFCDKIEAAENMVIASEGGVVEVKEERCPLHFQVVITMQ